MFAQVCAALPGLQCCRGKEPEQANAAEGQHPESDWLFAQNTISYGSAHSLWPSQNRTWECHRAAANWDCLAPHALGAA